VCVALSLTLGNRKGLGLTLTHVQLVSVCVALSLPPGNRKGLGLTHVQLVSVCVWLSVCHLVTGKG